MTTAPTPVVPLRPRPTATHVQFRCPDDVLAALDAVRFPHALNRSEIIVKALRIFLSLPAPIDGLAKGETK